MMADFFRSQMDYIFFCYGLAFILLVPICHFLNRRPQAFAALGVAGAFWRRPWTERVAGPADPGSREWSPSLTWQG